MGFSSGFSPGITVKFRILTGSFRLRRPSIVNTMYLRRRRASTALALAARAILSEPAGARLYSEHVVAYPLGAFATQPAGRLHSAGPADACRQAARRSRVDP